MKLYQVAGISLLAALTACSSTPVPEAQLGTAEEAIARAKQKNAYEYAPSYIKGAEDKLAEARALISQDKNDAARALLEQAEKDAEAALAKVAEKRERQSLNEVNESLKDLRKQIDMNSN